MTEFIHLSAGLPVTEQTRTYRRRRAPGSSTQRDTELHHLLAYGGDGKTVYVAVTVCGRAVKIGVSDTPVARVRYVLRSDAKKRGFGRPVLIRSYSGGTPVEREALAFMAPDSLGNEWFRIGPRFRIFLNRMDRAPRRLP